MSTVSIDFETHLIQPGLLTPPIVCLAVAAEGSDATVVAHWESPFIKALESKQVIVGANIAFDFGCALAVRPDLLPLIWSAYEERRVWDILIVATLNAVAEGRLHDNELYRTDGTRITKGAYSLDECVRESLNRTDAKKNDSWRKRYALLESTPVEQWPDEARQYPLDDVSNTLAVYYEQSSFKNLEDAARQTHKAFCIHLGSIWGLRANNVRVAALKKRIEDARSAVTPKLREFGFLREDGTKDMAVIRNRVALAYNDAPPKTASGAIATDRDTLEEVDDEQLNILADASRVAKVADTYIPMLEGATKRPLTVECNPVLATGRMSYRGLLQTMPRGAGVRECFEAPLGRVFCSVDFSAVEMATLAQVCLDVIGYSELAKAINADRDPHCILGADLIGVSYEKFVAALRSGSKEHKEIRQAGKAGNFGYPGMMGAAKFVQAQRKAGYKVCEWLHRDGGCGRKKASHWGYSNIELTAPLCIRCLETSESIRAAYLKRWVEVKEYWKWVTHQIDTHGHIKQLRSNRIRGSPTPPAAANSMFQGLAADGMTLAIRNLTREMYIDRSSPLYGSKLILAAHDEAFTELPENCHDAAIRKADIMINSMREYTPDVKIKAEPAVAKFWYKAMEPVYDEQGKLRPWEPNYVGR